MRAFFVLFLLLLHVASVYAVNKFRCDQQPSLMCGDPRSAAPGGAPALCDVQKFGAIGDGTTDDTAAIQLALDTCNVGGKVVIPSANLVCASAGVPLVCCTGAQIGTCFYKTTAVLLYYQSQTIEGFSTGGSDSAGNVGGAVIKPTTAGQVTFQAKNKGVSRTDSTRFINFGINITAAGVNAIGIDLTHVNEAHVIGIVIIGSLATGSVGIRIAANVATTSGGLGTRIERSSLGLLETGIQIRSTANANVIGPGNRVYTNKLAGISIDGQCGGGGSCVISDVCQVGTTDSVHKDCNSCSSTLCSANVTGVSFNNRIFDNWFELNGQNIYDVGKGTIIEGNYFEGATIGTCSPTLTTQVCNSDNGSGGTLPCSTSGDTCIDAPLIMAKGFDTVIHGNWLSTRGITSTQPSQVGVALPGVSTANVVRVTVEDNLFKGAMKAVVEQSLGASNSLVRVGWNHYESVASKVTFLSGSQVSWVDTVEGVAFASLPVSPGQGSMLLCTNCARTTPCTLGVASANVFARYTGTQWDCHERPPGSNNQVVYNNGGNWAADSFLTWSQGTAGRLGIGAPLGGAASSVHVQNDFAVTGTAGVYEADDYHDASGTGGQWISRRSRATPGAGAGQALASGDVLMSILGLGHDGTSFGGAGGASDALWNMLADQAFATSAHGSRHDWETTLNGTKTRCRKMSLTNAGGLRLFEPQVGTTCGVRFMEFAPQAQSVDQTTTLPTASGTMTVSSSQTNNALVKYSGTGGQVAPADCTESANLISGCNLSGTATGLNCTGCVGSTEIASTAVTAGSYGSSSLIPVITVDADGRLTAASTAAVVSGFPSFSGVSTMGYLVQGQTVFLSDGQVDPTEANAQAIITSTRTLGSFRCVNAYAQGVGHDIVVTLDTSACVAAGSTLTASTRTCTLTGAASGPQTCTNINGSITLTAGNCWALSVVAPATLTNRAVVNCTREITG